MKTIITDGRKDESTSVVGVILRKELGITVDEAMKGYLKRNVQIDPASLACKNHNYTISQIENAVIDSVAKHVMEGNYPTPNLDRALSLKIRDRTIDDAVEFFKYPDMGKITKTVDRQLIVLQARWIIESMEDYTKGSSDLLIKIREHNNWVIRTEAQD